MGSINRIVLCTSPLQVINARSAMEYNSNENETYCDYLIIHYPNLSQRSIAMIKELGQKLEYDRILDFSGLVEQISNSLGTSLNVLNKQAINENWAIDSFVKKIESVLFRDEQQFHEVYTRMPNKFEKFFIEVFLSTNSIFVIEDGMGEYFNYSTMLKTIIRTVGFRMQSLFGWVLRCIKGYKKIYIKQHLPIKYNIVNRFSNIEFDDSTVLTEYFIRTINKLSIGVQYKERKIVICGALLGDIDKFSISVEQEIFLYKRLIKKIMKKHNVKIEQIWYKPHPKCKLETWQKKKKQLGCSIYDYDTNSLFEVELLNPSLEAVYSAGSTSLLYGKVLFGIDSYLIDLRDFNLHPTTFEVLYKICKRYKIKIINVH